MAGCMRLARVVPFASYVTSKAGSVAARQWLLKRQGAYYLKALFSAGFLDVRCPGN